MCIELSAGHGAEGFQRARSEARPLIGVFGMSAATKQNGKLIDSLGGGGSEEKGEVCSCGCGCAYVRLCVFVHVFKRMYVCVRAQPPMCLCLYVI